MLAAEGGRGGGRIMPFHKGTLSELAALAPISSSQACRAQHASGRRYRGQPGRGRRDAREFTQEPLGNIAAGDGERAILCSSGKTGLAVHPRQPRSPQSAYLRDVAMLSLVHSEPLDCLVL